MHTNGKALHRIPLPSTHAVYARWGTAPLLQTAEPQASTASLTATAAAGRRELCALIPTAELACARNLPRLQFPGRTRTAPIHAANMN